MNPAEVACWLLRVEGPADDATLSFAERRRAEAMRADAVRHRYVHGRAALRRILGEWLDLSPADVPIERADGPIRLTGYPDCHVSLSHTGEFVAVAVADDGPVGIDIESTDRHHDRVPDVALTPRKVASAAMVVGERLAPLAVWVAQEAAMKADGIGLAFPLAEVTVDPRTGGLVVRLGKRSVWGVTVRALPGLVVAVAFAGPPPVVTCRSGHVVREFTAASVSPEA